MINTVPTERNGITNVICNLVSKMPVEDVSFDLVAINEPNNEYKTLFKQHHGDVYVIPNRLHNPIAYYKKLTKLIEKRKYDVVHVHGNSHIMAIEMLAAKNAGCKVRIAHSHNTTCKFKGLNRLLSPLFFATCNGRLACGEDAGKWLYGNRPYKIIKNGIDVEKFRFNQSNRNKIRKKLSVQDDEILIGHVGVFNDFKNQDFVVKVFNEFQKNHKTKLIFIGDGERKQIIEKQVYDLGLEKTVIFTGSVPNVNEYLSAIDVIVMPSFHEGLPLTLIEEQANGLSCVVSDEITKDADLTGTVRYKSLTDPMKVWLSTIEKVINNINRTEKSTDSINKIVDQGYSCETEANKVKDLYLEMLHRIY